MRRLTFPTVMPYSQHECVVEFPATREVLSPLGEPGFIEDDSSRTAGGRELFWAFEMEDGLRLELVWYEPIQYAGVVADPPEAQRAIRALREHQGDALVFLPGAAEIRRVVASLAESLAASEFSLVPLYGDLAATTCDGERDERIHTRNCHHYGDDCVHPNRCLAEPHSRELVRECVTHGP